MDNNFTRDMIFGGKKTEDLSYNNNIKDNMVIDIDLNKIIDFRKGQPFKLYSNDKKEEMKISILRNGIMSPIIVRKIEEDEYEILSGHNRVNCCRELDLKTIPARIVECDNDTATLIMIESNLYQRDKISIMEKAEAYKQQLDILKKDKVNLDHCGPITSTLSKNSDDSLTQIKRFIRLTYLINNLKDKVNNNEQSFLVGVELSYIDEKGQKIINNVIEKYKIKLTTKQASYIRTIRENIEEDKLINYLNKSDNKERQKFTGKLNKGIIKKYKTKFTDDIEFNELINSLLIEYFKM